MLRPVARSGFVSAADSDNDSTVGGGGALSDMVARQTKNYTIEEEAISLEMGWMDKVQQKEMRAECCQKKGCGCSLWPCILQYLGSTKAALPSTM